MTATIKAAISPFAQAKTEFDSSPMQFLNEDLASVPVSGVPEDFPGLSRCLQVTKLLVRKSAAHDETTERKSDPISPALAASIPAMSAHPWMQRRPN